MPELTKLMTEMKYGINKEFIFTIKETDEEDFMALSRTHKLKLTILIRFNCSRRRVLFTR